MADFEQLVSGKTYARNTQFITEIGERHLVKGETMDLVVDFLKKRQNVRKITGFFKEKGNQLVFKNTFYKLNRKGVEGVHGENKLRKVGLTAGMAKTTSRN